ncbi:MAG: hypothetical protein ACPGXK_16895 [Phycisphaerae bacterium]
MEKFWRSRPGPRPLAPGFVLLVGFVVSQLAGVSALAQGMLSLRPDSRVYLATLQEQEEEPASVQEDSDEIELD